MWCYYHQVKVSLQVLNIRLIFVSLHLNSVFKRISLLRCILDQLFLCIFSIVVISSWYYHWTHCAFKSSPLFLIFFFCSLFTTLIDTARFFTFLCIVQFLCTLLNKIKSAYSIGISFGSFNRISFARFILLLIIPRKLFFSVLLKQCFHSNETLLKKFIGEVREIQIHETNK